MRIPLMGSAPVRTPGAATTTSAVGDTVSQGTSAAYARTDHKHAREAFGTPVALGTANAQGSASTVAASDHVHTGKLVKIANQTIGNTQTTVAHGLSGTPTIVLITPTSNNSFWMSAASDGTNVYLTASASGTCDIYVAL